MSHNSLRKFFIDSLNLKDCPELPELDEDYLLSLSQQELKKYFDNKINAIKKRAKSFGRIDPDEYYLVGSIKNRKFRIVKGSVLCNFGVHIPLRHDLEKYAKKEGVPSEDKVEFARKVEILADKYLSSARRKIHRYSVDIENCTSLNELSAGDLMDVCSHLISFLNRQQINLGKTPLSKRKTLRCIIIERRIISIQMQINIIKRFLGGKGSV